MKKFVNQLVAELEAHANADQALQMEAYMKGHFPFYGIKSVLRRQILFRVWNASNQQMLRRDWQLVVANLWQKDQREYQYVAMDLMRKIEKQLREADLPFIEKLILDKSWWDTVDFLASHCIGIILLKDEKLRRTTADRYMKSNKLWLQRTALIFQLMYKENTDEDLLFTMVDAIHGSKEFFINKGAGWALRQYSKINPESVRKYIDLQESKLSGLTLREASKYL